MNALPIVAERDARLSATITSSEALPDVRAGSALALVDGRLLVAQDDSFTLVWVDPHTHARSPLALQGDGGALSKAEKPDFEAALVVNERSSIYVFGSGSAANRRWIAEIDVPSGRARLRFADRLYDALTSALGGAPNIEGAVRVGDVVRLLHRGSGRAPSQDLSAALDVPLSAISLPDEGEPRVVSQRRYDLGSIDGVPLTFTDAASALGGAIYVAVAEDTPDAIADGPIVGAALGVMQEGNVPRYAQLFEVNGAPCVRKPEGIALDPGGRSGFLITDPDDPNEPAELCRFRLDGPW